MVVGESIACEGDGRCQSWAARTAMDCEARRKERNYISGVEARTYAKLEAKARSGHDLEEQW